jgi:hypothetical protein
LYGRQGKYQQQLTTTHNYFAFDYLTDFLLISIDYLAVGQQQYQQEPEDLYHFGGWYSLPDQ